MFTKREYDDYFDAIEEREKAMLACVSRSLYNMTDENVRALFIELQEEEKAHVALILSIRKTISQFFSSKG